MANNYVLLQRIELNTSAASVTFSNIPQSGYTDLKVVVSARTDDGNTGTIAYIKFNGSSSTYSSRYLQGRGDSTASGTGSTSYGEIGRIPGVNSPVTNSVFSNTEITIPNYLSSNNKSYSVDAVTEANQTIAYAILTAGLWSTSSAITSILVASTAGNLVAGSTFSLYGLAASGVTPTPAKAYGGDVVVTDGTYWYHAFKSSGTFTPTEPLTCNYLVVAGGGGGGGAPYSGSGGGGAGGLRSTVTATGGGGSLESPISVVAGSYPITVGAGGAGGIGWYEIKSVGSQGSNSVFSTVTSIGGGYGNVVPSGGGGSTGGSGGSGGGAAAGDGSSATGTGGAGTANQGYAGGAITPGGSLYWAAGAGGGGAGSAGSNGYTASSSPSSYGGNGGAGVLISALATPTSTGVSGYYAGGGGGSTGYGTQGNGGSGGGGAGTKTVQYGNSGTANTGSGGGGTGYQGYPAVGGNGGSGIVIIRYPV